MIFKKKNQKQSLVQSNGKSADTTDKHKKPSHKGFIKISNQKIDKNKKPKTPILVKNHEDCIIETKNLSKSYKIENRKIPVLKNINLSIKKGEIIILLGESGGGKTTLLNTLGGLDNIDEGEILICNEMLSSYNMDQRVTFRRRHIGFIFQNYNLMPYLTAYENVMLGHALGVTKDDRFAPKNILNIVGMASHANKFPSQLSGGQNQRVCIARALSKNPSILLCDEPTGALDKNTSKEVLELFENIWEKYKTTIIFVTHNQHLRDFGHRVFEIEDGIISNIIVNKNRKSIRNIAF